MSTHADGGCGAGRVDAEVSIPKFASIAATSDANFGIKKTLAIVDL
jgi:hypothetical protein